MNDISNKNWKCYLGRTLTTILLVMYLCFLFWRMFFYAYGSISRTRLSVMRFNLIPFKSIIALLTLPKSYGFIVWGYNLFGNIAVFIPSGFLIPFLLGNKKTLSRTMLISFCVILSAELLQLITRLGVFDVDDIILNLIGCLIGYAISLYAHRLEKRLRYAGGNKEK